MLNHYGERLALSHQGVGWISFVRKLGWFWGFIVLGWFACPAHATETPCRSLYQSKKFVQAAKCFDRLLQSIDKKKQVAEIKRLLKDRYLLQGAISMFQASKMQQVMEPKAYYLEQAIVRLQKSVDKKYCKASSRCFRHLRWIERWKQDIRYSRLTIVTGNANSSILLTGYYFSQTQKGNLTQQVRPGTYKVVLKTPGVPTRTQEIQVKPNHRVVVNVTPIQLRLVEKKIVIAKKTPPLVITGYVLGSLFAAAGAGLLAYGLIQQMNLNAIRTDPVAARNQTDSDYLQGMELGRVMGISGSIGAGAGVFLLVGSGIAQSMSGSNKKVPPPPLNPTLTLRGSGQHFAIVVNNTP
ncbi:MAG: hypothetical protein EP343_15350 [Deltaproteobacteria bacterium]|nr:MAG: hypothetical protein EP343_15350 [Deltaproteobacteria bacterium]